MSVPSYDEALRPYIDEDGLGLERLNSSPGPETGNGPHILAIMELIRLLRGESKPEQVLNVQSVIKSCQVPDCPGLFNRGPRKIGDLNSHDNYRAISALSYRLNLPFAKDIHRYGKTYLWMYDNTRPGALTLSTWQRRFIGVVPTYRMNAGVASCWPDEAEISLTLRLGSDSEEPRSRILDWFTVLSVEGRACDEAVARWREGLYKKFPGGMREVFEKYLSPAHPCVVYCPEGV